MRYDGVDIKDVHGLVSLSSAGVGGWRRDIRRLETQRTDSPAYARDEIATYEAVINICGRTVAQGNEALQAVRSWAMGSGGLCRIDPHGETGFAYDGMLARVDDIELSHGFGTCRVVWELDSPHKYSIEESSDETGSASTVLLFDVSGTADTYGVYEITPAEDAQTLTVQLDGQPLAVRTEPTGAGATVRIDTLRERITLGDADVTAETDWTMTDYDRPVSKGKHELSCSVAARMTARWIDRWA